MWNVPAVRAARQRHSDAVLESSDLKAVVLDVDGTLYDQRRLRARIVWQLVCAYVGQPARGLLAARIIGAYRRAQESLRRSGSEGPDLALMQIQLAARSAAVDTSAVTDCVSRWMEHEPLRLLPQARRPGLLEFLSVARERGVRLGVVSDYPCRRKLEALAVADFFDVVVCAQDPEVQILKPHPRGLEVALRRLGVGPDEALYVGDRPETDAAAAASAGVRCAIIGRRPARTDDRWPCAVVRDYRELGDALRRA